MKFRERLSRIFDDVILYNSPVKAGLDELRRNKDLAFPGGEEEKKQRAEELRALLDYKYSYDRCYEEMIFKGNIARYMHDKKPTLDLLQSFYYNKKEMSKDDVFLMYLLFCEILDNFSCGDGFTEDNPVLIKSEPDKYNALSFKYIRMLLGKEGEYWKLNKTISFSNDIFHHNLTFRDTNINIYFEGAGFYQ